MITLIHDNSNTNECNQTSVENKVVKFLDRVVFKADPKGL